MQNENCRYYHRQFGATIVVAMGIGMVACFVAILVLPKEAIVPLLVGAILLLVAFLFRSLSIAVTDSNLYWYFGPGLIGKSVPLDQIARAEIVRTRPWEGWGIHFTSRGWLYNVSGFGAVAIQLKSGKRFVLGSDEPERLAEALQLDQAAIIASERYVAT